MSTPEHDKATSLLLKHNYVVKCVVNKDNKVLCKYNDLFEISYDVNHIDKNIYNLSINYYCDKQAGKIVTESISLPAYTLRWFIFLDILRLCRKHKLSHNIIRFFDEDDNIKDLPDLLQINMTDIDTAIELTMSKSIASILTDITQINKFDDVYITNGIFYDFSILKGLMV